MLVHSSTYIEWRTTTHHIIAKQLQLAIISSLQTIINN